ncbi:MAG TPA: mannose-6-phosphate isomerase, class I [Anaerolineae bacterium]|nr:mannose-6-phosphate isomerase, class I [Anaerolineae bacterium]
MSQRVRIEPRPYRLENRIQHYAWGTKGDEAYIPRLLGIEPEPGLPYAELWMGAHPNAPSRVCTDGGSVSLRQLIEQYPAEVLGPEVSEAFAGTLPFLFKILSAAEALSIQAHPNMEQAAALHVRDPEHYPDPNHKPELAIALNALTALMGFRPYGGILAALGRYPELACFLGEDTCARLHEGKGDPPDVQRRLVHEMFGVLVARSSAYDQELDTQLDALARRLGSATSQLREEEELFLELRGRYEGPDVGLFAVLLLNVLHLEEGQGVYIGPGIPHAYLRGNIVECMANSDNVVRVGLTLKYRDAETLIEILNDQLGPVPVLQGPAALRDVVYRTPACEFQVSRWRLAPGHEQRAALHERPEILLVLSGEVCVSWARGEETFRQGQSMLLPACLQGATVKAIRTTTVFRAEVPR